MHPADIRISKGWIRGSISDIRIILNRIDGSRIHLDRNTTWKAIPNKVKEENLFLFAKKRKRLIGLKKTAVLKKTNGLIICDTRPKDRGPTLRRTGPSFYGVGP